MSGARAFLKIAKTLVVLLPAFLIFVPLQTWAQAACDRDGIDITFFKESAGAVTLKGAKPKEITGIKNDDVAIAVAAPGVQTAHNVAGVLEVNSLDIGAFPGSGISTAAVNRKLNNAWEANFPRGLYNFKNKKDLQLEVILTVSGGQAIHISGSGSSTVSLILDGGKTHEKWWGGSKSLRSIRGNLNFRYSDLQQLGLAGLHRATVEVCVNIRGTID